MVLNEVDAIDLDGDKVGVRYYGPAPRPPQS